MARAAEPIGVGAPEGRSDLETAASLLTLADPDGVAADELQEELVSLGDRPGKVFRLASHVPAVRSPAPRASAGTPPSPQGSST